MELRGISFIPFVLGFSLVVASLGLCDAVAIWLFDEGEGKVVRDSSGNGNDGEITGIPLWVDGKFGKALYFDMGKKGVDYITVPDSDVLDLEDSVTVMAWIKPEEIGGLRFILKKEAVYEPILVDDKAAFYIANPSEKWKDPAKGSTSLKVGEWYHIAGTFDGETIRVYVNGKLDGEAKYKGKIGVTDRVIMMGSNVMNNQPLRNVPPFVGVMDEVAIFDEALSEDVIRSLMTKGLASLMDVEPEGKLSVTWGEIKLR
ncbi:TPA: LamG domain-containing protein [Candidatus Poribacteria bacterium]|nr:LamG domain-containing protein [Candidatus Poribacteria bacterium]HEX30357.1 LamG domain-containing protein [Candidatus Poribacteria bacterium]